MVHVMDNVLTKVRFWKYTDGAWAKEDRVWALPNMAELSVWSINADTSDDVWMTSSGYTQPTTLYYGSAAETEPPLGSQVKALPGQFNADGLVVEQCVSLIRPCCALSWLRFWCVVPAIVSVVVNDNAKEKPWGSFSIAWQSDVWSGMKKRGSKCGASTGTKQHPSTGPKCRTFWCGRGIWRSTGLHPPSSTATAASKSPSSPRQSLFSPAFVISCLFCALFFLSTFIRCDLRSDLWNGMAEERVRRYMSTFGIGWLERGGVLAMSNIRGGGEFGPTWHQAALKEKRHKVGTAQIAPGASSSPACCL